MNVPECGSRKRGDGYNYNISLLPKKRNTSCNCKHFPSQHLKVIPQMAILLGGKVRNPLAMDMGVEVFLRTPQSVEDVRIMKETE